MGLPALALAQGAGNILGGAMNAMGEYQGNKAAQKQIKKGMAENTASLASQQAGQLPWQTGGQASFGQATNLAQSGEAYQPYKSYEMGSFGGVNMAQDPGVSYRMSESNKALDASAGAAGTLHSGAQQKALQANAQNLASQEFGNAYNRQYGQFQDTENAGREQYNLDRSASTDLGRYHMADLMQQAQMGQSATNQMGANIGQANQNQLDLRGQMADRKKAQAAAPWGAAGNAIGGITSAGSEAYKSYLMGQK